MAEKGRKETEKRLCSPCHLTFEHQNDLEKHLEENHLFLTPDYEDQESTVSRQFIKGYCQMFRCAAAVV